MEQNDSQIIRCAQCGAKNRIPAEKIGSKAKCGKCGTFLQARPEAGHQAEWYVFRCIQCGAKNRIPSGRIDVGPLCGKCKKPLKTEELFEPQPFIISEANFEDKVLRSPLPVLFFAWAPWCSTCGAFIPVIDDFGRDSGGKIRVGKMNVDQNPNLSSRYNILSVPQIFVFDHGELKESFPGAMQKHELMVKMAHYL